jgi:hypothetical protein
VDFPRRDELDRRLHALVADFLDDLEADHPEGSDLGPVMLIAETRTPWDGEVPLRRSDAGYTPSDFEVEWRIWCSDWRWWVQAAMLREADDLMRYRGVDSTRQVSDESTDEDDSD